MNAAKWKSGKLKEQKGKTKGRRKAKRDDDPGKSLMSVEAIPDKRMPHNQNCDTSLVTTIW